MVKEDLPKFKMKWLEQQLSLQQELRKLADRLGVGILHHQEERGNHLLLHHLPGRSKSISQDNSEIEAAYLDSSVPQVQIVFLSRALDKGYLYRLNRKQ